jgi:hypothetical protein
MVELWALGLVTRYRSQNSRAPSTVGEPAELVKVVDPCQLLTAESLGRRCALVVLICVIGIVWAGPGPPLQDKTVRTANVCLRHGFPTTGGPTPAQTTPVTHILANRAHRQPWSTACRSVRNLQHQSSEQHHVVRMVPRMITCARFDIQHSEMGLDTSASALGLNERHTSDPPPGCADW